MTPPVYTEENIKMIADFVSLDKRGTVIDLLNRANRKTELTGKNHVVRMTAGKFETVIIDK